MKSAITICLAPEAAQGPFVFHEGLEHGCLHASKLGYDAVEIFPRDPDTFPIAELKQQTQAHALQVAAAGTGAGWVVHQLQLADPDAEQRTRAKAFVRKIIDLAGEFGAPAIIGSMQGRYQGSVNREQALKWLGQALVELGDDAARHGQVLLYEPLNRYETNLLHRQGDAAAFLRKLNTPHVKLLCDLFHMNIEEQDLAEAIRDAGETVGHVHWADSNRSAMGMGHTDPAPIVSALKSIAYAGYLSAEVFPLPNAVQCAEQTIASIRRHAST